MAIKYARQHVLSCVHEHAACFAQRLSSHAESRQKEDPFLHHKVRAGDRHELREGAGGVEGELHVPCGAKEGLRTYLPNRRVLL